MTYYSDLLIVIDAIEALRHGMPPRHGVGELRRLCAGILAVDPDEALATQLLAELRDMASERDGHAIGVVLFEKYRSLAGLGQVPRPL